MRFCGQFDCIKVPCHRKYCRM